MRTGLLFVFWLCIAGTFIQVPLLCYESWLIATTTTFSELTVWVLLTEHLTFLSWITVLAKAVFGASLGGWILALPATGVTIFKLVSSTLIGYWAIRAVRRMEAK